MKSLMFCILTQNFSCEKIQKNELGRAGSAYRGEESAYRVLMGKSEGKRFENDIKMDLQEV